MITPNRRIVAVFSSKLQLRFAGSGTRIAPQISSIGGKHEEQIPRPSRHGPGRCRVEAGVAVTGTLERPLVRVVSNPAVPEGEALSWLMLGRAPELGPALVAWFQRTLQ